MFTTEFESLAGARRGSLASVTSITVSSQSSRRSSVTSLSDQDDQDYQDADEFAFQECIEIIDSNVEEVITNKADAREKKWWKDGNYKIIDEERLPLILVEDVSYEEFEKKCERANASKYWEYQNGTVAIIELPKRDHEIAHGEFTRQFLNALSNVPRQNQVSSTGSTTCSSNPGRRSRGSSKQSDASFTPKQLPRPTANPCDAEGNPWPTVIVEIANTQSLRSIIHKTTKFWLAPNRVEDAIVLKLWKRSSKTNQNGTPLRRLTCYKFCRRRSPKDALGNYLPVRAIEFGTIDGRGREYNGCTAVGMCTLTISPRCIFRGCPLPYPIANNVVIDLFDIQQEIFDKM